MEQKIILLKAVVQSAQEDGKVLTVKLVDGFGSAECIVHKGAIVEPK